MTRARLEDNTKNHVVDSTRIFSNAVNDNIRFHTKTCFKHFEKCGHGTYNKSNNGMTQHNFLLLKKMANRNQSIWAEGSCALTQKYRELLPSLRTDKKSKIINYVI